MMENNTNDSYKLERIFKRVFGDVAGSPAIERYSFEELESKLNTYIYGYENVFERVFGADGYHRYTPSDLQLMLNEMYDCYKWVSDFGNEMQVKEDLGYLSDEWIHEEPLIGEKQ